MDSYSFETEMKNEQDTSNQAITPHALTKLLLIFHTRTEKTSQPASKSHHHPAQQKPHHLQGNDRNMEENWE